MRECLTCECSDCGCGCPDQIPGPRGQRGQRGPPGPTCVEESTSVTLSFTPDDCLQASVILSADPDNILSIEADGLFAEGGSGPQEPMAVTDTASINLTIGGTVPQTLSADVKISADPGNTITIEADGLFAAGGGVTEVFPADASIEVTGGDTIGAVISADGGNALSLHADGLFAVAGAGPGVLDVTTAALNALVAGSTLSIGTTYRITDHSQGRVPAGTKVVVQALSGNQITSECQVLTSYDATYWRGVYDITTNKLLELQDNLGNICRQFPDAIFGPFTPVDDFDWGNTNITNCLVDNSTWTTDYGLTPSFGITALKLTGNSTFDTTGWTGDYIYNMTVSDFSNVDISDSAAEFEECSFTQGSGVYIKTTTSGDAFLYLVDCQSSFISCDEALSALQMEGVTLSGYSGIYHSGSGELNLHKGALSGAGEIRIVSGGVVTTAYIDYFNLSICEGSGISPIAGVYISGTSTFDITLLFTEINSKGLIQVRDVTVDDLLVEGIHISAGGNLILRDSGTLSNVTVAQGTLDNDGFDLTDVYILGAGTSTCTANNTGTAKDYFNDTIV